MSSLGYKASFTDIYSAPDPRSYLRELSQYDYQVPQNALPWILPQIPAGPPSDTNVLDLCCSYGFNAMLLNHSVSLWQLRARYQDPALDEITPETLIDQDREFYRSVRAPRAEIRGLDISQSAIDYAAGAGLLEAGWAENLEESAPSQSLAEGIRGTQLITCTGGISYITDKTITRVLECLENPGEVRAALFALRQFDMGPIQEAFARFGVRLERQPGAHLRQRTFVNEDEQAQAVDETERRGLDPTGLEAEGWYYADVFLTQS
ncbi:hypothetical protein [Nesterenkonia populi]